MVWIALVAAETVVRGPPSPWPVEGISCATLTLGYVLLARAVSRRLGQPPTLAKRQDFLGLLAMVVIGALLNGTLYIGALVLAGDPPPPPLYGAVVRYWIGDVVGLLVTLPMLFALGHRRRRVESLVMFRTIEWWVVLGAIVAIAYLVFAGSDQDQFKFFYLFFLPLVWLAARFGVTGATWSAVLVQILLVVGVQSIQHSELTVFELQLLMATLAGTALLLGTTVDEREEVARALHSSLHLAAAGQTAAALAHELNQPLTALSTYARASQLLAGRLAEPGPNTQEALIDVTHKLVSEATRASEVVKRLRNFFRERTTELRLCDMPPLLEEARQSQAAHAASLKVELRLRCEALLPRVWIDEVQMDVVLRNLMSNAIDAAAQGEPPAWVEAAMTSSGGNLLVSVRDSGSGIMASQVSGLFEPHVSTKPGGMGIGLSICKSIVEAHGGRLWAEPGTGGHFVLSLPLSSDPVNE
jgi:two-component system sensor kinase FixL